MAQAAVKSDVGGSARGPLVRIMPWGQAVRWQLPVLMANAQIRFAKQVHELLTAQGIQIGHSRVHELVIQAPARLTVEVQFALCRIFDCTPSDLWFDLGQVPTDQEPDLAARQRLRSAKVVRAASSCDGRELGDRARHHPPEQDSRRFDGGNRRCS
jgi:hypothetical protein